ncbi:hypothetical protein [Pseudoalteromonas sp. ZZD1]|uniref:hypothetical protein n=1 Tax=Pseudoalteromonas sp. ZZD1 TaxID=3139395 RepID=UPI003BA930E5
MFSFKPILIGLTLVTFSSSAFALSTTEQRDYDRIISGQLGQIKTASKSLVSNHNNNSELLDILAQYVSDNYESASTNNEIDTMAWACRALGETGTSRYKELLTLVMNNSQNKKLRKYAKKALNRVPSKPSPQFKPGSIDFEKIRADAESKVSQNNIEKLAIKDIANGNLNEIMILARQYSSSGIPSQQVGDTLAEYFAQNYKTGNQKQYDTLAWVCKGLATDENGRYKTLIEDAEENSPIRAVRKHCPDEIKGSGPFYQTGTVDLEKVAKQLQ